MEDPPNTQQYVKKKNIYIYIFGKHEFIYEKKTYKNDSKIDFLKLFNWHRFLNVLNSAVLNHGARIRLESYDWKVMCQEMWKSVELCRWGGGVYVVINRTRALYVNSLESFKQSSEGFTSWSFREKSWHEHHSFRSSDHGTRVYCIHALALAPLLLWGHYLSWSRRASRAPTPRAPS